MLPSGALRAAVAGSGPLPAGFAVTRQDAGGIDIVWQLPEERAAGVLSGDGRRLLEAFPDWGRLSPAGRPELPCAGALLPVPASGDVRVEAEELDVAVCPGFAAVTAPRRLPPDPDDGEGESAPPRLPGPYPSAAVETAGREWVGGEPVLRLRLFPFRLDADGSLRVARRLVVRVRYSGEGDGRPAGRLGYECMNEIAKERRPAGRAPAPAGGVEPGAWVKLEVTARGLHRVSGAELAAAGADLAGIDAATLRLRRSGADAAFRFTGTGAVFQAGDVLEFFGLPEDNDCTGTGAYWLTWGGVSGEAMGEVPAAPGGGDPLPWFADRLVFAERKVLWAARPGPLDAQRWFWAKFTAPGQAAYTVAVAGPDASGGEARLEAVFMGRSATAPNPDHHVVVSLNGTAVGEVRWDGVAEATLSAPFSPALLRDRDNAVAVSVPGDTGAPVDVLYLSSLAVECRRAFRACGDRLEFALDAGPAADVAITGFRTADVRVFDITDPGRPAELDLVQVTGEGDGFTVRFRPPGAGRFLAAAGPAWLSPAAVKPRTVADWTASTTGADLLLVTDASFLPAAARLAEFRRRQGLRVALADVESLYDSFTWGVLDPQAIRALLSAAYWDWPAPRPRFALLLGAASTDYRCRQWTKKTWVPAYHSWTEELGLTPDDNWYACVDGADALPDLAVGRLCPAAPAEAEALADRILHLEGLGQPLPARAILAADNNEPSFQQACERVAAALAPEYQAGRVYLSAYGDFHQATGDLLDAFDAGSSLAFYAGHGNTTIWAGEPLLSLSDVDSLANADARPFTGSFSCLNAYFALPQGPCLAEGLAQAPGGGAAAVYAASGLSYQTDNDRLMDALAARIDRDPCAVFGFLAVQSKLEACARGASPELLTTYTLVGDPVMRCGRVREGDVDGDGAVGETDFAAFGRGMAGSLAEGAEPFRYPTAADRNRDGRLDAADLVLAALAREGGR